jgi:uncharacterized protein
VNQSQYPGTNHTSLAYSAQRLMPRVFGWMFAGLMMTAIIALVLSGNPNVPYYLATHSGVFWGIVIAEFIIVMALSSLLGRMSPFAATFSFFLYAALNGVTLSLILAYFNVQTVAAAFFISAGMFGLFAAFGYVTKIDMTRFGSIALMLILGLVLASVVNIFFVKSSMLDLIISYALVVLFCGVTAYDIQKIKAMSQQVYDEETGTKLAIFGALMLYLDFIIIFKNLLRIFSRD